MKDVIREALRKPASQPCSCFDATKQSRACVGVCEDAVDRVADALEAALSQANARADAAETEVARLRNALTITVNALSSTTDAETAAEARCAVLARELAEAREAKDSAYRERNQVVAALAKLFPSGTKATDIPSWDPEWNGCVYIDLPTGQASWHYHVSDEALFSNLPPYAGRLGRPQHA
jgi:hypothetical protein